MIRTCLTTITLCCLASRCVSAFERPIILLISPRAIHETGEPINYSQFANVLVMGEIKPSIGTRLKVCIYSVTREGKLFRLISANTPIKDGTFNIDFDAPSGGWPIGQLRMEATLADMRQVKTRVNVTVVPPEVGAAVKPITPADDSGITLDFAKCRGTTVHVPSGKLFYLRGQLEQEGVESKLEGPAVSVHIAAAKSTLKNGYSVSLRQAEDKPVFEYEVELEAPQEPGAYSVRLQPTNVKMWWKVLEDKKPDFTLEVTESER